MAIHTVVGTIRKKNAKVNIMAAPEENIKQKQKSEAFVPWRL